MIAYSRCLRCLSTEPTILHIIIHQLHSIYNYKNKKINILSHIEIQLNQNIIMYIE